MQPSLDLRRLLLSFMTVAVLSCCAFGQAPPPTAVSDQKAGSILFYPFYSSSTTDPAADSRIATTNTNFTTAAFVHIFMVSGSSCNVADFFSCFTAAQTSYFLASVLDPGTSGYILMVAVDGITGCPVKFNYLIGDGFVKLASGLHGNYGAESIAAILDPPAICDDASQSAQINFNDVNYEQVPRVLALDNFPAIGDGYTTRIWVSRVGGDLFTTAGGIGTIFGVLYNDAETGLSFSLSADGCQRAFTINDTDVRTTPRPSVHVPANSSGWLRFWSSGGNGGIFAFAATAKAGLADVPNAFAGGRNLHKLRFTEDFYIMPVFPPTC